MSSWNDNRAKAVISELSQMEALAHILIFATYKNMGNDTTSQEMRVSWERHRSVYGWLKADLEEWCE